MLDKVRPVKSAGMMGGDEHNDIESRAGGSGYDNWTDAPRR